MQKKSSVASSRNHPRIPINYGVAAEQESVPGSNRCTLEAKKGISSCLRTSCGVEFPLKSNIGIVKEVEPSVLPVISCSFVLPKQSLRQYAGQVPAGTAGAYASALTHNVSGKTSRRTSRPSPAMRTSQLAQAPLDYNDTARRCAHVHAALVRDGQLLGPPQMRSARGDGGRGRSQEPHSPGLEAPP